jgi:ribosomal protein L40E
MPRQEESMIGKLRNKFSSVKGNLTSLDSQPLGKATLIIILFLDLFILLSVFNGLDEHTGQLSSPDEYIPQTCRDIVINLEWNRANRLDNLSNIIIAYSNSYDTPAVSKKSRHPLCAPFLDIIDSIKNDQGVKDEFEERNTLLKEARALQRQIGALKGGYDTSLLESIAGEKEGQANVDKIRKDVQDKTSSLNALRGQIDGLEQKIDSDDRVKLLWEKLQGLQQPDREALKSDLRSLNSWYPVTRLGMELVFLLPLLAIFNVWNNVSIRRNRGIQTLVSSHLLVVSFIPLFFKIVETVYDIIPKILLKKLIELLEKFNLVAIWYYLVMALGVAAALFTIYIFQKKLFSREKLIQRRIAKGQCQKCGSQLPHAAHSCPFCGFLQLKPCASCQKPTYVFGKYCIECGNPQ